MKQTGKKYNKMCLDKMKQKIYTRASCFNDALPLKGEIFLNVNTMKMMLLKTETLFIELFQQLNEEKVIDVKEELKLFCLLYMNVFKRLR